MGEANLVRHAPPHCLPHLRLRHPIGLHRARHDHADAAVARRIRRDRGAADSRFPQDAGHQGDVVHSRLYHRELAAGMRRGGCGRARSCAPQLGAHSAGEPDARGGRGRPRARQRGDRPPERAQGARLPLAVLGFERSHHRASAGARLPIRFEPDGRRLSAVSRAARRRRQARRAVPLRRANPADRDADQLVARRLPAFRVRAHAGDHPRQHAAGAGGDAELARRVSLHEEDGRLGRAHLHHASLRDRPRLPHAGARRPGRQACRKTARCS